MAAPQIGEVHDGYRYGGGDPNAKGSWSYVGASQVGGAADVSNPNAPGAYLMAPGAIPKIDATTTKDLSALRGGADKAMSALSDARRFRSLNATKPTGGLMSAIPGYNAVRSKLDPQVAEMRAISEKLVPQNREAGSGAMSDSDAAMYRAATVGLDKPQQANEAMSRVIGAASIRQADRAAFMDEYARRNGSLVGAQEIWSDYAGANPLFEEKDGNTHVKGWTPWRTYFGIEKPKGGGQMGAPSAAPAGSGYKILSVE